MNMIFPGMDPYLENPLYCPGLHNCMLVYLADHLQKSLGRRYVAAVEERVYREGPDRAIEPHILLRPNEPKPRQGRPGGGAQAAVAVLEDVEDEPLVVQAPEREIHESYVTILDLSAGQKVVTVIELVSPSNTHAGPGRTSYVQKQREVLSSEAHLVEIDLLRGGPHVLAVPEWRARGLREYDYLICVNRAVGRRDRYEIYPRTLRQRLPRTRVPLAGDDPDVRLDLQAVLNQTYEAGRYRDRINYDTPCVPPLRPEDQTWAEGLLREAPAPAPDPQSGRR